MKTPVRERHYRVPEEALWRLLHAGIGPCLLLLEDWLTTGERDSYTRAVSLFARIRAGAGFLPAKRLHVFCSQWRDLLRKPGSAAQGRALILQTGVRLEQSIAWGCRIQVLAPSRHTGMPLHFVLMLHNALQSVLRRAVSGQEDWHVQGASVLQVARFWVQGESLLPRDGVEKDGAEDALASRLLELYRYTSVCRMGFDLRALPGAPFADFLWLSRHALMVVLLSRWRAVSAARQGRLQLTLNEVADVVVRSRVCLRHFMQGHVSRGSDVLCELAESLLHYLQCGFSRDPVGERMLLVCFLTLEQRVCRQAADLRSPGNTLQTRPLVERRIRRFLRVRRHRLKESLRGPGNDSGLVQARGLDELQTLLPALTSAVARQRNRAPLQSLPDELLYLCTRLCVCMRCMGQELLYEVFSSVRNLFVQAVEQRVVLTPAYLRSLQRVLAHTWALLQMRGEYAGVSPVLRAHQMACGRVLAARCKPDSQREFAGEPGHRNKMSVDALPIYLADHLHALLVAPELLQSPEEAEGILPDSRDCLLELALLAQGARALAVRRVADLAEGLMEVHRAVQIDRGPPSPGTRILLGEAHRMLRACLNHAAARQCVPDVRGLLARLYAWLETAVPRSAGRQANDAVNLSRALTAGMRALEDALVLLPGNHRQALPMIRHLLVEQQSRCMQLEEELEDAGRVRLGRWRSRLWRVAARCANATDTEVRMSLENDALQLDRRLADALLQVVEQALEWLLNPHRTEHMQPPDSSVNALVKIQIRPRLNQQMLALALVCEGGLPDQASAMDVPDELRCSLDWLGADLRLRSGRSGKQVLLLSLPAQAPRWDIAAKPL